MRSSGRVAAAAVGLALVGFLPHAGRAHNGETGSGSVPVAPPTLGPPAAGPQDPQQPSAPVPRATTGGVDDAWRRWWELQAPLLVPSRVRVVTDAPPTARGDADRRARTLDDAATHEVIPALLWAADPRQGFDTDVVTAAYRALGRLARAPEHVEPLLRAAQRADTAREETETAVGALGLLRRSDPARRLDDATLSRARRILLLALDDEARTTRSRCTAATALGMLADQGGPALDAVARDLWARLGASWASDQLPSAMLAALGRFPRAAVGEDVEEGLRALGLHGRFRGVKAGPDARGQALLAHARLRPEPSAGLLLAVLLQRRLPDAVRLGALTALGLRAGAFSAAERVEIVRKMRAVVEHEPSRSAYRPAGLLATARVVAADLAADSGLVLEAGDAEGCLLEAVRGADVSLRPFGMLALGLAGRRTAQAIEVRAYHAFRTAALRVLRGLLKDGGGSVEAQGAFLVGLGLLGDEASIPGLLTLARDDSVAPTPRGFAVEALGLVGRAAPEVTTTMQHVGLERRGDPWVRGKAAAGLSRLGGGADVVTALADDLDGGGASWRLAALAAALGRSDRVEAVEPLVRALRGPRTKDEVRARVCDALGRLCDPEDVPSVVRLAEGALEMPADEGLVYLLGWAWL